MQLKSRMFPENLKEHEGRPEHGTFNAFLDHPLPYLRNPLVHMTSCFINNIVLRLSFNACQPSFRIILGCFFRNDLCSWNATGSFCFWRESCSASGLVDSAAICST